VDIKAQVKKALDSLKIRWYASKYKFPEGYKRIYHYHIRKSAGTSLNSAFWRLAGLDLEQMGRKSQVCKNGLIFVRHNPSLINQGQYFYANSHNPSHRISLPDNTFTITILRDPLKRLISYHRYLYYVKHDSLAIKTEPYYREVLKQTELLGDSFEDFLKNVPQRDLLNQLYMFSESYDIDEASEKILKCSAVCFTETFSHDLRQLNQRLDLALEERRDRSFQSKIELHGSDIEQARELLEKEFKLLQTIQNKMAISP
jgi:hypothetical protein